MKLLLTMVALAGLAAAALGADVTEVSPGMNTEAVKAFKRGLEFHIAKQWPQAIKEYERAVALREYEIVRRLDRRLGHCLRMAIDRNDPDYNDMPWNTGSSGASSLAGA